MKNVILSMMLLCCLFLFSSQVQACTVNVVEVDHTELFTITDIQYNNNLYEFYGVNNNNETVYFTECDLYNVDSLNIGEQVEIAFTVDDLIEVLK